jgi:membrane associated rhomboid family serine protease/Tfp pilus assembly protein PilF
MAPDRSQAKRTKRPLPFVTIAVGLAAILVGLSSWLQFDTSSLTMSYRAFEGQPWRVVTPALVHIDVLNLAINLYWLWVFGTALERRWGHVRAFGIMVLLAAGSLVAEYALLEGTVGLTGVTFGLFGLLWVLSRTDEEFRDALKPWDAFLFVAWFGLCIYMRHEGKWPTGMVALATGLVLGFLLGLAARSHPSNRPAWVGAAAMALIVIGVLGSLWRPEVNFSRNAGREEAAAAAEQLANGDVSRAADLYERAVKLNERQAAWWFELGECYKRQQREVQQYYAYQRAHDLEPANPEYRTRFAEVSFHQGTKRLQEGRAPEAAQILETAVKLNDRNAPAWHNLGCAYLDMKANRKALDAFERAVSIDPRQPKFLESVSLLRQQHLD